MNSSADIRDSRSGLLNELGLTQASYFVLVLGLAISLWSVTTIVSGYLATTEFPQGKAAGSSADTKPTGANTAQLETLRTKVSSIPDNEEARIELGRELIAIGQKNSDSKLLMEGLEHYSAALRINPQNLVALRELAAICLENAVLDKALEYYDRILAIVPDDDKAQVDRALALVQLERHSDAIAAMKALLERAPALFAANMTLAVAYRGAGELPAAEAAGKLALQLAPNDEGRTIVSNFLNSLKENHKEQSLTGPDSGATEQPEQPSTLTLSPANTIAQHLNSHPIIAPKIVAIRWSSAELCLVELKDFPVEQMPEFAKQKFLAGLRDRFAKLPEKITLRFVEANTDRQLLELTVGR